MVYLVQIEKGDVLEHLTYEVQDIDELIRFLKVSIRRTLTSDVSVVQAAYNNVGSETDWSGTWNVKTNIYTQLVFLAGNQPRIKKILPYWHSMKVTLVTSTSLVKSAYTSATLAASSLDTNYAYGGTKTVSGRKVPVHITSDTNIYKDLVFLAANVRSVKAYAASTTRVLNLVSSDTHIYHVLGYEDELTWAGQHAYDQHEPNNTLKDTFSDQDFKWSDRNSLNYKNDLLFLFTKDFSNLDLFKKYYDEHTGSFQMLFESFSSDPGLNGVKKEVGEHIGRQLKDCAIALNGLASVAKYLRWLAAHTKDKGPMSSPDDDHIIFDYKNSIDDVLQVDFSEFVKTGDQADVILSVEDQKRLIGLYNDIPQGGSFSYWGTTYTLNTTKTTDEQTQISNLDGFEKLRQYIRKWDPNGEDKRYLNSNGYYGTNPDDEAPHWFMTKYDILNLIYEERLLTRKLYGRYFPQYMKWFLDIGKKDQEAESLSSSYSGLPFVEKENEGQGIPTEEIGEDYLNRTSKWHTEIQQLGVVEAMMQIFDHRRMQPVSGSSGNPRYEIVADEPSVDQWKEDPSRHYRFVHLYDYVTRWWRFLTDICITNDSDGKTWIQRWKDAWLNKDDTEGSFIHDKTAYTLVTIGSGTNDPKYNISAVKSNDYIENKYRKLDLSKSNPVSVRKVQSNVTTASESVFNSSTQSKALSSSSYSFSGGIARVDFDDDKIDKEDKYNKAIVRTYFRVTDLATIDNKWQDNIKYNFVGTSNPDTKICNVTLTCNRMNSRSITVSDPNSYLEYDADATISYSTDHITANPGDVSLMTASGQVATPSYAGNGKTTFSFSSVANLMQPSAHVTLSVKMQGNIPDIKASICSFNGDTVGSQIHTQDISVDSNTSQFVAIGYAGQEIVKDSDKVSLRLKQIGATDFGDEKTGVYFQTASNISDYEKSLYPRVNFSGVIRKAASSGWPQYVTGSQARVAVYVPRTLKSVLSDGYDFTSSKNPTLYALPYEDRGTLNKTAEVTVTSSTQYAREIRWNQVNSTIAGASTLTSGINMTPPNIQFIGQLATQIGGISTVLSETLSVTDSDKIVSIKSGNLTQYRATLDSSRFNFPGKYTLSYDADNELSQKISPTLQARMASTSGTFSALTRVTNNGYVDRTYSTLTGLAFSGASIDAETDEIYPYLRLVSGDTTYDSISVVGNVVSIGSDNSIDDQYTLYYLKGSGYDGNLTFTQQTEHETWYTMATVSSKNSRMPSKKGHLETKGTDTLWGGVTIQGFTETSTGNDEHSTQTVATSNDTVRVMHSGNISVEADVSWSEEIAYGDKVSVWCDIRKDGRDHNEKMKFVWRGDTNPGPYGSNNSYQDPTKPLSVNITNNVADDAAVIRWNIPNDTKIYRQYGNLYQPTLSTASPLPAGTISYEKTTLESGALTNSSLISGFSESPTTSPGIILMNGSDHLKTNINQSVTLKFFVDHPIADSILSSDEALRNYFNFRFEVYPGDGYPGPWPKDEKHPYSYQLVNTNVKYAEILYWTIPAATSQVELISPSIGTATDNDVRRLSNSYQTVSGGYISQGNGGSSITSDTFPDKNMHPFVILNKQINLSDYVLIKFRTSKDYGSFVDLDSDQERQAKYNEIAQEIGFAFATIKWSKPVNDNIGVAVNNNVTQVQRSIASGSLGTVQNNQYQIAIGNSTQSGTYTAVNNIITYDDGFSRSLNNHLIYTLFAQNPSQPRDSDWHTYSYTLTGGVADRVEVYGPNGSENSSDNVFYVEIPACNNSYNNLFAFNSLSLFVYSDNTDFFYNPNDQNLSIAIGNDTANPDSFSNLNLTTDTSWYTTVQSGDHTYISKVKSKNDISRFINDKWIIRHKKNNNSWMIPTPWYSHDDFSSMLILNVPNADTLRKSRQYLRFCLSKAANTNFNKDLNSARQKTIYPQWAQTDRSGVTLYKVLWNHLSIIYNGWTPYDEATDGSLNSIPDNAKRLSGQDSDGNDLYEICKVFSIFPAGYWDNFHYNWSVSLNDALTDFANQKYRGYDYDTTTYLKKGSAKNKPGLYEADPLNEAVKGWYTAANTGSAPRLNRQYVLPADFRKLKGLEVFFGHTTDSLWSSDVALTADLVPVNRESAYYFIGLQKRNQRGVAGLSLMKNTDTFSVHNNNAIRSDGYSPNNMIQGKSLYSYAQTLSGASFESTIAGSKVSDPYSRVSQPTGCKIPIMNHDETLSFTNKVLTEDSKAQMLWTDHITFDNSSLQTLLKDKIGITNTNQLRFGAQIMIPQTIDESTTTDFFLMGNMLYLKVTLEGGLIGQKPSSEFSTADPY